MSLEELAKTELLSMRKHTDGVTPGALARTSSLLQVLGGGDPMVAYNALKHAIFAMDSSLEVTAATYSLGFASDGNTHLDRLTDFGTDYGYDQRQARRYSDKGIDEIARYVASQWTIQSSPNLELQIVALSNESIECLIHTECYDFIEMRLPVVQAVNQDGTREEVFCDWQAETNEVYRLAITHIAVERRTDSHHVSVLWNGELWPRFSVVGQVALPGGSTITSLGARLSVRLPIIGELVLA